MEVGQKEMYLDEERERERDERERGRERDEREREGERWSMIRVVLIAIIRDRKSFKWQPKAASIQCETLAPKVKTGKEEERITH